MFFWTGNFLTQGHERSIKIKKNVLASFGWKGISILTTFLLVPITIDYLNPTRFGIWITLTSIISWFGFFDLGLGNGLRNKFTEAVAKGETHLARIYVSTTYVILSVITFALFVLFAVSYSFVDWAGVLNADVYLYEEIARLVFITFSFFCIQFVVKLINMILIADQRPAFNSAINAIGNAVSLGVIYILTKTTDGSLIYIAIAVGAANISIPVIFSFGLFRGEYKMYRPSFRLVNLKYGKQLFNLGFQFFIMHGAVLIVMATDNLIIAQVLSPAQVTPYAVAYKYFSAATIIFTIITTPFWSAYADAWFKNDLDWIRTNTKKLVQLWFVVFAGIVLMVFAGEAFYRFWVGDQVNIPLILTALMAAWVTMASFSAIFGNFLSGVSKIRISLYHAVFVSIVNIPLSIYFASDRFLALGSAGVILASCVCVFPRVILQPIQYFKLVNGTARGIWNK